MKKFYAALTAAAIMTACFSTSAFAAPLKNYDVGKFAIDAGITFPSSLKGGNYKMSKSDSSYYGATVGIGKRMALNYQWDKYKGSDGDLTAQQFNLMYQLLPNVSAYAGWLGADADVDFGNGKKKNSAHAGLQAHFDIPLLFTVYGNVGVGTKSNAYEIGISKPLFNNIELNLSYYDGKFKDVIDGDEEMRAKGVQMGVTVKF
ncbi:MAG: TonB-dependent receptor [Phascolarctobacterium sp.]|nr:TonB-dependent receptor [Phascolarctobacterium sp.]MBO5404339.1 TonB-dependent receptor [Phascolarctobacterium sp.]